MQGFEKLPTFRRALRASQLARAAQWDPFAAYDDGLHFAEGMFFGIVLMLPFWALVAYAISVLTH
jgi:hypothetical protein